MFKCCKVLLLIQLLHSCYVVDKSTYDKLDFCYPIKNINSSIRFDGYYFEESYYKTNGDLTYVSLIEFTEDGLCTFASIDQTKVYDYANVSKRDYKSKIYDVGLYEIRNDTIRIERINASPATSSCEMNYYKILNSGSLRLIFRGSCDNPPSPFVKSKRIVSDARFITSKTSLNSDSTWIKKKKWFWCDKQAYKAWKRGAE